jgi:hypothetical protein
VSYCRPWGEGTKGERGLGGPAGGGAEAALCPHRLAAKAGSVGAERESRLARGGEGGALHWGLGAAAGTGWKWELRKGTLRLCVYVTPKISQLQNVNRKND